jgi:hypothetical protein
MLCQTYERTCGFLISDIDERVFDEKAQVDASKAETEQLLTTHLSAESVIVFNFRVSTHVPAPQD